MAEKALYVLAGYDDETERELARIQNVLYEKGFSGSQTKGIPMHFTLGSYDTSREEELKERLEQIAKTQAAFPAGFNHIGLFTLPASDVLFLQPEITTEMLQLKDCFKDNMDTFPWSPHTTLLIDKREEILRAIPIVEEEFKPMTSKVSALYLYEFWPTRHILTVQLS
ncbi:MAG: 2'-5' RNA ligase family protein [Lachnospiraceae bacterium]|nr:2'-5' RNA ligase family protein [Lachnospiraceae bacterium]